MVPEPPILFWYNKLPPVEYFAINTESLALNASICLLALELIIKGPDFKFTDAGDAACLLAMMYICKVCVEYFLKNVHEKEVLQVADNYDIAKSTLQKIWKANDEPIHQKLLELRELAKEYPNLQFSSQTPNL